MLLKSSKKKLLYHVKNRDMLVITIASFLFTVAFFLVRNMLFFGVGVMATAEALVLQ